MKKDLNETLGIFDSWEIINKEVAIKKCDKSFFVHHGSGIPIETRWFFDTNELQAGARKEFILIFRKSEYKAYITRETASSKRTRIFWHTDLSKIFNNLFEHCDTYPSMRFKKVADEKYEISFIDIDLVENENNDNLESQVPSAHNPEGRKVAYYITKYERNSKNRGDAIKIHGTKCIICNFDYAKVYGDYGKDFIEVHHVRPLYDLEEEMIINPETDLVCVCSNCHRMIHRKRDKVLSVDDLKNMIQKKL